jgi:MFS family permease
MFLGGPVIQLAPVFARVTFGVDQRAYGFLAAALGIGATAGSVVIGAYGDGVRRSRLAVGAIVTYGVAVLGMAVTPTYAGGVAAMFCIGVAYLAVASVLNTAIQLAVDDRFRGRVIALYAMVFTGSYPLGSLLQGMATDRFGVRVVVGVAGAALLGYAALLAARPGRVATLDLEADAGGFGLARLSGPTVSAIPAGRPDRPSPRSGPPTRSPVPPAGTCGERRRPCRPGR